LNRLDSSGSGNGIYSQVDHPRRVGTDNGSRTRLVHNGRYTAGKAAYTASQYYQYRVRLIPTLTNSDIAEALWPRKALLSDLESGVYIVDLEWTPGCHPLETTLVDNLGMFQRRPN